LQLSEKQEKIKREFTAPRPEQYPAPNKTAAQMGFMNAVNHQYAAKS